MRQRNPACNYAQIPNDAMRDERLTIEARGLLALLMTYADEWQFHKKHLMGVSRMGSGRFERVMGELREAGYLETKPARDERGRLSGHKWMIRDDANRSPENQGDGGVTEALKSRATVEPRNGNTDPIRRPRGKEHQGEEETQSLSGFEDAKKDEKPKQDHTEAFNRFWAVYPKKVGKPAALKNWNKAIKAGADPAAIIAAAAAYAKTEAVQRGFIKHPQGWLSEERWTDPDLQPPKLAAPVGETLAERRDRLLNRRWTNEVVR